MNKRLCLALSFAIVCGLSGCTVPNPLPQPSTPEQTIVILTDEAGNPIATVTPPPSTIEDAYAQMNAPLAKEALEDGVITEEEVAAVKQDYIDCLTAEGLDNIVANVDGSGSVHWPDTMTSEQADAVMVQCESEDGTGWAVLSYFYIQAKPNPDNIDFRVLMADCLVRVGLKPEGYTAEQYAFDMDSGGLDEYLDNLDSPDGQKFVACTTDPLHTQ